MKWWMWDFIGGELIECLYALVSPEFGRRINAIVAEAVEGWLNRTFG